MNAALGPPVQSTRHQGGGHTSDDRLVGTLVPSAWDTRKQHMGPPGGTQHYSGTEWVTHTGSSCGMETVQAAHVVMQTPPPTRQLPVTCPQADSSPHSVVGDRIWAQCSLPAWETCSGRCSLLGARWPLEKAASSSLGLHPERETGRLRPPAGSGAHVQITVLPSSQRRAASV